MEKNKIDKIVNDLLTKYGYDFDNNTDIDIVAFVKAHGFIVGNATLPEKEDGFLAIRPNEKESHLIGVNRNRPVDYKRFVIAHEFAHSVLHYKSGAIYLHRENKKGKDEQENDADYFAAALLMPQKSFIRRYRALCRTEDMNTVTSRLATEFRVPLESVERRIQEAAND